MQKFVENDPLFIEIKVKQLLLDAIINEKYHTFPFN